jgi:sigma-54 specific flagellar transcriptional regulator A
MDSTINDTLKRDSMTEIAIINTDSLFDQSVNLKEILSGIELRYIREALEKCNGVVSHAALKLGLRRTTLIEKMKKYNI